MDDERRELIEQGLAEITTQIGRLRPGAPDFPLQWAKIVGMVSYMGSQASYVPTSSGPGLGSGLGSGTTTTAPTLKCPNCGLTHELTLK
jgi:hypothetical protein